MKQLVSIKNRFRFFSCVAFLSSALRVLNRISINLDFRKKLCTLTSDKSIHLRLFDVLILEVIPLNETIEIKGTSFMTWIKTLVVFEEAQQLFLK